MFEKDIAQVLSESLDRERECNEIVREDLFKNSDLFNETFSQVCQQRSVCIAVLANISEEPVRRSARCSLNSTASKIQQYKAWTEIY